MIYQAYGVLDRDVRAGYEDHGVSAYGSRRIQLSTVTAFYQMVPGKSCCGVWCISIPYGEAYVLSLTSMHFSIAKSVLHLLMAMERYGKGLSTNIGES